MGPLVDAVVGVDISRSIRAGGAGAGLGWGAGAAADGAAGAYRPGGRGRGLGLGGGVVPETLPVSAPRLLRVRTGPELPPQDASSTGVSSPGSSRRGGAIGVGGATARVWITPALWA